jgi:uncharacterized Tic20 family protein
MESSPNRSDRSLGASCHFLAGLGPVPVLIIGFVYRDRPFVVCQAREVLNLQIHLFLVMVAVAVLAPTPEPTPMIVVAMIYICGILVGSWRTFEGYSFRYPLLFRIVK